MNRTCYTYILNYNFDNIDYLWLLRASEKRKRRTQYLCCRTACKQDAPNFSIYLRRAMFSARNLEQGFFGFHKKLSILVLGLAWSQLFWNSWIGKLQWLCSSCRERRPSHEDMRRPLFWQCCWWHYHYRCWCICHSLRME